MPPPYLILERHIRLLRQGLGPTFPWIFFHGALEFSAWVGESLSPPYIGGLVRPATPPVWQGLPQHTVFLRVLPNRKSSLYLGPEKVFSVHRMQSDGRS